MMSEIGRLEGNGPSRFVQLMRRHGYNKDIAFSVAKVTQVSPSLAIRIDGDPFDLSGDEIVFPEHLLEHRRRVSIAGGAKVDMVVDSPLSIGDYVIVVVENDGQLYYVLDKAY